MRAFIGMLIGLAAAAAIAIGTAIVVSHPTLLPAPPDTLAVFTGALEKAKDCPAPFVLDVGRDGGLHYTCERPAAIVARAPVPKPKPATVAEGAAP